MSWFNRDPLDDPTTVGGKFAHNKGKFVHKKISTNSKRPPRWIIWLVWIVSYLAISAIIIYGVIPGAALLFVFLR